VDPSIAANRRPDDLYHAYNLARFDDPNAMGIRRLYEMLEGQVAALSSGRLDPEQGARLLEALRRSAMFRPDHMLRAVS
jgi:DNA-binding GntR family transcriptional regulator